MNRRIRLLLTLDGFRIFSFGLLGPIYGIFVERIGGDILDAGIAFSVYSMVLGILAFFVGRLSDKIRNQSSLLFVGYGLLSIGFFSYLLVKNPFHILIVQVILGVGGAFAAPIFDAFFSACLDKGKYDTEWASWEAENFILTGIAAIIGAIIAKFLGFKFLFIVMGIGSLMSLFFLYFLKGRISKLKI